MAQPLLSMRLEARARDARERTWREGEAETEALVEDGVAVIPQIEQYDPDMVRRVLLTVIAIGLLIVLQAVARRQVEVVVRDRAEARWLRRTILFVSLGIGVVFCILVWLGYILELWVFLVVLVLYVAFTIREIAGSVVGWLAITFHHLYTVGDRVELGGIRGDVIRIDAFGTTLQEIGNWVGGDQHTGRVVAVPNVVLLQQPVYNYSQRDDLIWDEIRVPIAYGTNWRKARDICLRSAGERSLPAARDVALDRDEHDPLGDRQPLSALSESGPSAYVTFNDNWIEIALRYPTPTRARRRLKDEISRDILAAIEESGDVTISSTTLTVNGTLSTPERSDGAR